MNLVIFLISNYLWSVLIAAIAISIYSMFNPLHIPLEFTLDTSKMSEEEAKESIERLRTITAILRRSLDNKVFTIAIISALWPAIAIYMARRK